MTNSAFTGAKAALFCQGRLLVYLRDTHPGLPWPGHWDLPGGGREGDETPEDCLLREVEEEFGLRLPVTRLEWRVELPSMLHPGRKSWFFSAHLTAAEIAAIRFGNEGQRWEMMALADWLAHPQGVPDLQRRTRLALAALTG